MTIFRRFVAIGDSSTEGLIDPDGNGGLPRLGRPIRPDHRRRPDRTVVVRQSGDPRVCTSRRSGETQFGRGPGHGAGSAHHLRGANDIIAAAALRVGDLVRGPRRACSGPPGSAASTVLTFTMPDPTGINPLGSRLRPRVFRLNDMIRAEAERYGVLVMDFQRYPIAEDPAALVRRSAARQQPRPRAGRVGAGLASRAFPAPTLSWADPFPEELVRPRPRERLSSDVDWAVHHFGPFLSKGLRGIRQGWGIEPKRPVPTLVEKSPSTAFAGSY